MYRQVAEPFTTCRGGEGERWWKQNVGGLAGESESSPVCLRWLICYIGIIVMKGGGGGGVGCAGG